MIRKITPAQYLENAIMMSGKSQKDIAFEVKLKSPNILSMMKQGLTKIPLARVPALAKACGVDPAQFLQVCMLEYEPEIWEVIRSNIGEVLSDDERRFLKQYREQRDL